MDKRKRYAANTIVHGNVTLRNGVVTIEQSMVESYLPLCGEQANTVWLGGKIILKKNANGSFQAFHNETLLK